MLPMIIDKTARELLDAFAASDPTPGGGSASALASAVGAALLQMVAALPKRRRCSRRWNGSPPTHPRRRTHRRRCCGLLEAHRVDVRDERPVALHAGDDVDLANVADRDERVDSLALDLDRFVVDRNLVLLCEVDDLVVHPRVVLVAAELD